MIDGRLDEAETAFATAIDFVDAWRYIGFGIGSLGLAALEVARGAFDAAIERATPIATENRRMWLRARGCDVLAAAALGRGDEAGAAAHAARATALREEWGFVLPPALRLAASRRAAGCAPSEEVATSTSQAGEGARR